MIERRDVLLDNEPNIGLQVSRHVGQCIDCGAPAELDLCRDCAEVRARMINALNFRLVGFRRKARIGSMVLVSAVIAGLILTMLALILVCTG